MKRNEAVLDPEAWKVWDAYRSAAKWEWSDRARRLSQNKLARMVYASQMKSVQRSIDNGWQGLFEVKEDFTGDWWA